MEVCSFAATGNVLRVQRLLHLCGEHLEVVKEREEAAKDEKKDDKKDDKKEEEQKPDDTFLSFAVLGISIIATGEEIGSEMSMRQFNHLVSLNNILRRAHLQATADALRRSYHPQISASSPWFDQCLKSTATCARHTLEIQPR